MLKFKERAGFYSIRARVHTYFLISQVTESTEFNKLADQEPWLSSTRLVVKPDMLFGKRGKSGLVGSVHLKRFEISLIKFFWVDL